MIRKKRRRTIVTGGILTLMLVIALAFTGPNERYFEIQKNLDIFVTMFKEVNAYYVEEVDPEELITTGINAMLQSLDPYTNYIPEEAIEDYRTMTTNQYGGIGSLINKVNNRIVIAMPHEGFPAHKAGLKIGDEIVSIDGVNIQGKSTSEVSKLLKGQPNNDVTIQVKRFGEPDILKFTLTRKRITIDNVSYFGKVSDDIGYIKLTDFTTEAGKEVKEAVKELKNEGATSIILDVRGNPGGLLNEAINVVNVFIDKGKEVVSTRGKVKEWNKSYKALNQPIDTKVPLVVLTNRTSASAAEIVAGVVQDYDRGLLVGRMTYGKGLVQATRPLTYNSQLKITTAKYYIPSGRCIQSIDYAKRNRDGSVQHIPDSLKIEFKTSKGRTVYDGGGITPDFEVNASNFAPITVSLLTKGLIFDYATKFYYEHDHIGPAREFELSDQAYESFIQWLSNKDYDYITDVEENISDLIATSKEEKLFDLLEKEISSLNNKVKHNKERDLVIFKDEIKNILEREIAARYYLQEGEIEASFSSDNDIIQAISILKDQSLYERSLTAN